MALDDREVTSSVAVALRPWRSRDVFQLFNEFDVAAPGGRQMTPSTDQYLNVELETWTVMTGGGRIGTRYGADPTRARREL